LSRREALWRILLLEERHEKEKHEGAEVQRHEAVAAAPRGGRRPAEKPPYASRQVPSNKEHRKPKASLFADLEPNEPPVTLPKMSMAEVVSQDYESNGFSLNAHPMELVREDLESSHGATKPRSHEDKGANAASNPRIIRNVALRKTRNAQRVAVAGLVTCRQRPSTASGIVFMTLEDETAMANLVVKPEVYQRYRSIARGKTALIAQGKVQRVGEVIHVMVERLFDLTEVIGQLRLRSRDFH
jgi:error-prone DNA polymerase